MSCLGKIYLYFRSNIIIGLFFKTIFFTVLAGVLGYAGPVLIRFIINYIQDPEKDVTVGILLVSGIILSRLLVAIFNAQAQIRLVNMPLTSLLANHYIDCLGYKYRQCCQCTCVSESAQILLDKKR